MDRVAVGEVVARQRAFFLSGRTRDVGFRRDRLRAMRAMLLGAESRFFDALRADLGRPAVEAYGGDTGLVRRELDHALRHLTAWTRPRRVRTILMHFPARS